MSGRVLATPEARQAVGQMKTTLTSGLAEQVSALKRQGDVLTNKNQWDGRLASEFTNNWQGTHMPALQKMLETLNTLQRDIDKYTTDIMIAGGQQG